MSIFRCGPRETVNVTTLTGGNPDLDADRRTVFKIGGNWRPFEKTDLKLRGDFVHQSIDRPQISFPAATPALEAAFPLRFVRDDGGQLICASIFVRSTASARRSDTVRWGFDFTKPLRSQPPSRGADRRVPPARRAAGGGAAPSAPPSSGGPPSRTQAHPAGR